MGQESVIVIPARMASTRFPGKPLVKIHGISMLERVWRIARQVKGADAVVIATDSEELREHAGVFGAEVIMTSSACRTGTDRVAEALNSISGGVEVIFSLQGDAVLTPPWVVEQVLEEMKKDRHAGMGTPAVKLSGQALSSFLEQKRGGSSSGTCVVFDAGHRALYFSKAVIPYDYGKREGPCYRHIGLYAYREAVLRQLTSLEQGEFERVEKLEQLRALEHGISIRVVLVDYRGRTHASVDRPEDIALVEQIIEAEGELI